MAFTPPPPTSMETHEPEILHRRMYNHHGRAPMLMEFAEGNLLRCTSIVEFQNELVLRRTQLRDGIYIHFQQNGFRYLKLIFNCRLEPTFLVPTDFVYDDSRGIWKTPDEKIELEVPSAKNLFRFTKAHRILEHYPEKDEQDSGGSGLP